MGKTPDLDHPPHLLPTMALNQISQYHLQGDAMQRINNRILNYEF
jgi:hypothetical protein